MSALFLNLLLAVIWAVATGNGEIANLVVGFVVGYLVLWWVRPLFGDSAYFRKLPQGLGFLLFFLWEMFKSNLIVAWDVLTPQVLRRPGIVAVPLDARTDTEITLLANIISLTPGTLSLDVSDDRSVLYVHGMFVDDPAAFRQSIKQGFERRLLQLLR
ncbi:MAG: Na+/H+ antiporter subunit E [Phycisphaerales bacterium]|nr:Na+/H+ antiporter subunit E [Phycisphaerales bacterium]